MQHDFNKMQLKRLDQLKLKAYFQKNLFQMARMCSNISSLIFYNIQFDLAIFTQEKSNLLN